MISRLLMSVSQNEIERTSERTKIGLAGSIKNGIFDDNDNQIVNDVARKIKPVDELDNAKTKKKNNMELK